VKFLKSWLDWVQKEEGRTYGDPILEAIQRLERKIETRSFDGSVGSQGGEYEGSRGRSWAQVAGAGATGGTGNTGFNKNATAASKAGNPSTAQGDPCEIRIRMNNPAISTKIRQKPNTSDHILKTVNNQISQSENINRNPHTAANTQEPRGSQNAAAKKWIRAAKMLGSGDIFLYAWDVSTAESIIQWKADWIRCLGEKARVQMPAYGVILSDITVTDTQMENQAGMISRFWEENDYLPLRGEITRMRWLGKQKEGKASQRRPSGTTENALLHNALNAININISRKPVRRGRYAGTAARKNTTPRTTQTQKTRMQ
jgi:hypothetical protein